MSILELEGIAIRDWSGISKEGRLTINSTGASWIGEDGNELKVPKKHVRCLVWIPVQYGFELALPKTNASVVQFTGFRDEDFELFKKHSTLKLTRSIQKDQIATAGEDWGQININGKIIASSLQKNQNTIFKVTLRDLSSFKHSTDELTFEFADDEIALSDKNSVHLAMDSVQIPAKNNVPDPEGVNNNSVGEETGDHLERYSDNSNPLLTTKQNEDQNETDSQVNGLSDTEMVDDTESSKPERVVHKVQEDPMILSESDEVAKPKLKTLKKLHSETKKSKGINKKESLKKQRKKKDNNAPKKNLSAYVFFCRDIRSSVKEEHPDISFGGVGKVIGEKWKALTVEQKIKYEDMAKNDKARYTREKLVYDQSKAEEEQEDEEEDVVNEK
eukprot:g5219.t1